jgi:5'-3' exoribonuclease 1
MNREREEQLAQEDADQGGINIGKKDEDKDGSDDSKLREVSPGRYAGKFETHDAPKKSAAPSSNENEETGAFSSVVITPGTPFFGRCTAHIEHFIQYKLSTDPAWQHLTIVFSGPNVPGEGEHKIMQFMREQRERKDYDPNIRHCIMGQDGDLVMLGLVTHEPNLVLLREQVIFDQRLRSEREAAANSNLDLYIHNANFEFLHMNILRDYLAFEFKTSNVMPGSKCDIEAVVDDFVFMTFFVGNDFLPHMPALDIADEAFDLMFYTYRDERNYWLHEGGGKGGKKKMPPYLTDAGTIVSGERVERFLSIVGGHESPYYDNKKSSVKAENERNRNSKVVRAGPSVNTPTENEVADKEGFDRAQYREMLQSSLESSTSTSSTQPADDGDASTTSDFAQAKL